MIRRATPLTGFLAFVLLAAATAVPASGPALWEGLEPGPAPVGFEVRWLRDRSRTFFDRLDAEGRPRAGELTRPMQVAIWYPASSGGTRSVTFGEYLDLGLQVLDFAMPADAARNAARKSFVKSGIARGARSRAARAVPSLAGLATRQAASSGHRAPLVVIAQGTGGNVWMTAVMAEYLASHGFVVASSPSFGPWTRGIPGDYQGLETQVRDVEFVIGSLHQDPRVDPRRIGLIGFSFGGAAVTMAAMRRGDIGAVVSLDGSDGLDSIVALIRRWPFFSRQRFTMPYLRLDRPGIAHADPGLIRELVYSPRTLVSITGMRHTDFTTLGALAAVAPGFSGPALGDAASGHAAVCRLTAAFLEQALGITRPPQEFLAGAERTSGLSPSRISVTRYTARAAPPSEKRFLAILDHDGPAAATQLYESYRASDPRVVLFSETALNAAGYRLLQAGRADDAVAVFKLNTEAYPGSWNVWDSLGEAYAARGARQLAVRAYRRSLKLNPDSPTGHAALKRLGAE